MYIWLAEILIISFTFITGFIIHIYLYLSPVIWLLRRNVVNVIKVIESDPEPDVSYYSGSGFYYKWSPRRDFASAAVTGEAAAGLRRMEYQRPDRFPLVIWCKELIELIRLKQWIYLCAGPNFKLWTCVCAKGYELLVANWHFVICYFLWQFLTWWHIVI